MHARSLGYAKLWLEWECIHIAMQAWLLIKFPILCLHTLQPRILPDDIRVLVLHPLHS